jgi:hypothetical protein
MMRRCNARRRGGARCRKPALKGGLRCRLHGARAGRPRGVPLRPDHNTALQAGRARWVQQMRVAKQRGVVVKFPNGRKPGVRGRSRPANKTVARALRIVEEEITMRKMMPAPAAAEEPAVPCTAHPTSDQKAPARMTLADDLLATGGLALERAKHFLGPQLDFEKLLDTNWLNDPENRRSAALLLKFAEAQMTAALKVISDQIEAGTRLRSRAAESAERDRVLNELARDLRD